MSPSSTGRPTPSRARSGLGSIDDLAVNPQTNRVYIGGISKVHVLDGATNNVVATVSDLPSIRDLAVNPQTGRVYVTHPSDDIVSVIQDEVGPPPLTATATRTVTRTPTPTGTATPAGTPQPPDLNVYLHLPLVMRGWPPLPDVPVLHGISNPDGDGNYMVR